MTIFGDGMKICSKCKKEKPLVEFCKDRSEKDGLNHTCRACAKINSQKYFSNPVNREKSAKAALKYKKENETHFKKYAREYRLNKYYNLSLEDYDKMFEAQNGCCAICGQPETTTTKFGATRLISIDHDHKTGKIRGLLCTYCNTRLGWYEEQKENIKNYLKTIGNNLGENNECWELLF